MFNIKQVFIIFIALVVISGCKKSFLDVEPQGNLTEEQALKDPDAAEKMVGGVYNTLYMGGFDPTTFGFLFVLATDVASDDGDKGSTPSDFGSAGEIDNFTFTPSNFIFDNIWRGHYTGIARANRAIDILSKSTFDETVKNRLIGESRFIRALYYFNLVRLFGGVPKLIRVPEPSEGNNEEFQTRATKEAIYQIITEDLQFGVDNLPEKSGSGVGKATKGAAQAYLAKVYLYLKNYQKAYELSKAVMTSNKYSLVRDYNLIFRQNAVGGDGGNNNSESIFEIQTGLNVAKDAVSPLFSNGQGARSKGGWNDVGLGFNTPTSDLVSAYEPNDVRKNATVIFITPTLPANSPGTVLWDGFRIPSQDSVENSRYSYKAYHSILKESVPLDGDKDKRPKNIRTMRYAEVLLINAEAAANAGGDAQTPLNEVRERAGLTPVPATIANIWKERRVELAMEQDRFFDLVRQGRAGTVLRAHGKNFVDGKNELFPIPQNQRDLSGGRLAQNPGYGN
ncbi:RagB/SusD family nutrient uptake outer membrane protein [Pedobacter foliorum]|uniref:RagB/SusD family nutrient uptake outer membrane protein n=1 Tax=Pedobacter foliorum TaxID=2739058 RepID=UPI001566547F|nr:RagB/SusD family nutrient uptake outer membrane protein [Pedobacter foliorum]NRF41595.1 RagB/SusD family nutrient uptake outer membrane protein [Pedobacter foliorum]